MSVSRVEFEIDVRNIPIQRSCSAIFESFQQLEKGKTMRVIHDHNPRPFYFQFECEFRNRYTCIYEKSGPDVWQVVITKMKT